ncbi:MAG: response regulator, partial [Nitrosopumilaceae archaeon]|nr:response regulator [Nitrosopumilaceae archaeon]
MKTTRAIVIDDDKDTLEIFCEFLKLKKVEVVGKARNGLEALNIYKATKPDIVLMDVMMPDYNGFFGLEKIKKFDKESKVVMVTADLTESTAQKLNDLGADEILYKPYEIEQVMKTINKLLAEQT